MKLLGVFVVVLWAFVSGKTALAQAVVVQSGDHNGFTRLVLDFGTPIEWHFGRTSDGYEFDPQETGANYNLSQVYKLIQRNRLTAIWVDPESGNLRLRIGCACHAIPFELRPGIVVIDLLDGSPPENTSSVAALDGTPRPGIAIQEVPRPRMRPVYLVDLPYNWTTSVIGTQNTHPDLPVPMQSAGLLPMRNRVLRQMSEAAVFGTIEMAMPTKVSPDAGSGGTLQQIRIGERIGFDAGVERKALGQTDATTACLIDNRLDIDHWGDETSISEQIAIARNGLIGEFDSLDPVAIKRAAKFYLYIGFGAEAEQLLQQMPIDDPDQVIWNAMARILDQREEANGPFVGMQSCDTAAAFWATLDQSELTIGVRPNLPAILRSFSSLPVHLRRHLGPILSGKFLAKGDTATARAIRDAILRAPGDPGPDVRLMSAKLDIANGETEIGSKDLYTLSNGTGPPAAKALISYVDALILQDRVAEPQTLVTFDALLMENRGTAIEPELLRAQMLAIASRGDFDAAFVKLGEVPNAKSTLWHLLANKGSDDAILLHAVTPDAEVPLATRLELASRLNALGLPDSAQLWLVDITEDVTSATDDDRILAAQISLHRHDARTALRMVAGLNGEEAAMLRALAQVRLGDLTSAERLFNALGDSEAELRSARAAHNWKAVAEKEVGAWQNAAALLTPILKGTAEAAPAETEGALAQTRRLLAESAAARTTLSTLLTAVPAEAMTVDATQ